MRSSPISTGVSTHMTIPRDLLGEPLTVADFKDAASEIGKFILPSPQIAWPLLAERCDCEVWVKHENHLPTGSFKVRGGLWFMRQLEQSLKHKISGVIAATRGNHGQSVAFAARRYGLKAYVVVPYGNNPDKNRSMRGLGAEVIEHGTDFNEALDHAMSVGVEKGLYVMPSYDPMLVQGVGTYAFELLKAQPDLDVMYVPVGMGSGASGSIAARDALGAVTEIVGVVAEGADAYALSFEKGEIVETKSADTIADGLAVRIPDPQALKFLQTGLSRIVRVSDDEIRLALRAYFHDTHNLAEGAGAAALAALLKEGEIARGKKVGLILSGGNIDRETLVNVLT